MPAVRGTRIDLVALIVQSFILHLVGIGIGLPGILGWDDIPYFTPETAFLM